MQITAIASRLCLQLWVKCRNLVNSYHDFIFWLRCYILGDEEENEAFRDDFRRCAIMAFFKNCLEQIEAEKHENLNESQFSWVKSDSITFALEMFNQHYNTRKGLKMKHLRKNVANSRKNIFLSF